jgi:hypothetical protein
MRPVIRGVSAPNERPRQAGQAPAGASTGSEVPTVTNIFHLLDPQIIYKLAADYDEDVVTWWAQPIDDPAAVPVELTDTGLDEIVGYVRDGNLAAAIVTLERLAGVEL